VGTQVIVSLVPMASATLTVSQVVVALELRSLPVVVPVVPVTAIAVVLAATTTPATKPATAEDVRAMGVGSLSHGRAGTGPRQAPTGVGGLPGSGLGAPVMPVVQLAPGDQEVMENPLKTASMFSPG
jgi:hypothetical protein